MVLEGFRDRFRVDFGMFLEGNFEELCIIFGVPCTLENLIFIWFLLYIQHSSVSENLQKITKRANCEALFSETRSERILEPIWVDFWTILGGFLGQSREK